MTDICLGRHREVIAELERLTVRRPDEGEVWILLAIALYRSDRISEAGQSSHRTFGKMLLKTFFSERAVVALSGTR